MIAETFAPRYEQPREDLVTIDVSGLGRLLGPPAAIGAALAREASARRVGVQIAVAATRTAAMVMALSRRGPTVIGAGEEAAALAPIPVGILAQIGDHDEPRHTQHPTKPVDRKGSASAAISAVTRWGVRTLGDLARLPPADLAARLGRQALLWQAIARGEDTRPLVPALAEERFDSTLELEWPIEGLEPLSFVLTRLLEPLSARLERRDRGAAVLHIVLRLVTRDRHARRLQLPTPIRDVRTLRALALLDLESHPPPAAIDRVTVVIDPTPGRVLQHTLFTRAHPTPERLSTLLARLGALVGQDRIGAAVTVDSYRPGAFAMKPFATAHDHDQRSRLRAGGASASAEATADRRRPGGGWLASLAAAHVDGCRAEAGDRSAPDVTTSAGAAWQVVAVLRRCRQPVPARVAVDGDCPVRVTTDRRGFAGGSVTHAAGPWRTSGHWWTGGVGRAGGVEPRRPVLDMPERHGARASGVGVGPHAYEQSWNRDEWDVSLSDGGVYRIFRDRETDGWFIDAVVD